MNLDDEVKAIVDVGEWKHSQHWDWDLLANRRAEQKKQLMSEIIYSELRVHKAKELLLGPEFINLPTPF